MTRKSTTKQRDPYLNEGGRFRSGNPGRPKGSKNKTPIAIQKILEADAEKLTSKAIALALEGDTTAMRLCLERISPAKKDLPVEFDLPPLNEAKDAARAAQAVLAAVSDGTLSPSEGATTMGLVDSWRKTLETTELETRVKALEKKGSGQ